MLLDAGSIPAVSTINTFQVVSRRTKTCVTHYENAGFFFRTYRKKPSHPNVLTVFLTVSANIKIPSKTVYCQNTPKLAIALSDTQVRNVKPKQKPYKLADGAGLYLLVNPDGAIGAWIIGLMKND